MTLAKISLYGILNFEPVNVGWEGSKLNTLHPDFAGEHRQRSEIRVKLCRILGCILSKFSLFTNKRPSLYFLFQRISE